MTTVTDEIVITALADAIIDILQADSGLDRVPLFIRGGTPSPVPQDFHPFCEVIIGEEAPDTDYSGAVYQQTYTGIVTFTCQQFGNSDWLDTVQDRKAHVASYDIIAQLLSEAVIELQRDDWTSLDNLVITNTFASGVALTETVSRFYLTGPRVYGLEQRENNYQNFGSVAFIVETDRTVN